MNHEGWLVQYSHIFTALFCLLFAVNILQTLHINIHNTSLSKCDLFCCAFVLFLLEPSKSKCKPGVSKRRKGVKEEEQEEGERKEAAKRLRGPGGSDPYESNDTDVCQRDPDSSPLFDKMHKSPYASKPSAKREKPQSAVGPEVWTQKKHPSQRAADEEALSQSAGSKRQEVEKPRSVLSQSATPSARCNGLAVETGAALVVERRGEGTDRGGEETETRHDGTSHTEDSEAVSALLAYQESERLVSMETSACVVFNALPGECELPESELPPDTEVKSSDDTTPEAMALGSQSEAGTGQREEQVARNPPPPRQGATPEKSGGAEKPTSPSNSRSTPKGDQGCDAAPRPKSSPCPSPPENLKSKQHISTESVSPELGRHRVKRTGSSPNGAEPELLHSGYKTQPVPGPVNPTPVPNQTQTTFSNKTPMPAAIHTKIHMPVAKQTTAASTKLHPQTHTAVTPTKAPAAASSTKNSTHAANRGTISTTPTKPHISPITPTKTHPNHSRTSVLNQSPVKTPTKASNHTTNSTPTKSPLIVDRNEPFTVYRDPALVGEDLDVLQPQGNVAYIHPSPHAGHTKHASLPAPRPSPHAAQQAIHVSTASNCSLSAPRSTHATHLSPPPSHTPHLLKTPSPSSQSALSSLGSHVLPAAPPHPSLPHPLLLACSLHPSLFISLLLAHSIPPFLFLFRPILSHIHA